MSEANEYERVRGKRWLGWALWAVVAAVVSASCGGTAKTGTDSQTHWLEFCEDEGDCGALDCVCGVCTAPCDDASNCDELGEGSSCREAVTCASDEPRSVCAVDCTRNADCSRLGADYACYQSQCVPERARPAEPNPCAAMDAVSNGDDCVQVVGYSFDGTACYPVVCGCAGDDCENMYSTIEECDSAYTACYRAIGLERDCEVDSDCALTPRQCCGGLTDFDAVIAFSSGADYFDSEVCDGRLGCPTIALPRKPSLYAECVAGQCRTLDVESVAGCSVDDDCQVRVNECCNCPDYAPGAARLAVAVPDEFDIFKGCSRADIDCICAEGPPDGASATCDVDFGMCALVSE